MKVAILYICYEDMSGHNGAVRHVTEVVRGLSRNGHRICLCVPRMHGNTTDVPDFADVGVEMIPTLPVPVLRPISYLAFLRFRLPAILDRFAPDAIYLRDIKFTTFPVEIGVRRGIPVILEINGLTDEIADTWYGTRTLKDYLENKRKHNVAHARHVVTVTSGIKEEISASCGVSGDRITVVPNGVDPNVFRPTPIAVAKSVTGLSTRHRHIGFVGGLFPWHGIDLLIDAAPRVVASRPETRFVVVGSGPMESALRASVRDRGLTDSFIFTGPVPFSAVPYYISSFDVCVAFFKPVRKDPGNPIKLYEYMACGRPVVASRVSGYGDMVESMDAGISVDSADPVAVSAAILSILGDQNLADRFARNAASRTHTFAWSARTAEIEQIVTMSIGETGQPADQRPLPPPRPDIRRTSA